MPSFAIFSGVTLQRQAGSVETFLFDGSSADPTVPSALRIPTSSKDLVVSPFVGGILELMTPAIPIPTRPRFFVAGEFIPMFPAERNLALEGQPNRIRGPELGAINAVDETNTAFQNPPNGPRNFPFSETASNGQGAYTRATMGDIAWGARAGLAFPLEIFGRHIRIKPSFGWMQYTVDVEGLVVDPRCSPQLRCTNIYNSQGVLRGAGFLRESILSAETSKTFNGYGPGLDLELDTGRYGPLGIAIFIGVQAYYFFDDREISIAASQSYDDPVGVDTQSALWRVRVSPWMYRGAMGIRFQWLGMPR